MSSREQSNPVELPPAEAELALRRARNSRALRVAIRRLELRIRERLDAMPESPLAAFEEGACALGGIASAALDEAETGASLTVDKRTIGKAVSLRVLAEIERLAAAGDVDGAAALHRRRWGCNRLPWNIAALPRWVALAEAFANAAMRPGRTAKEPLVRLAAYMLHTLAVWKGVGTLDPAVTALAARYAGAIAAAGAQPETALEAVRYLSDLEGTVAWERERASPEWRAALKEFGATPLDPPAPQAPARPLSFGNVVAFRRPSGDDEPPAC